MHQIWFQVLAVMVVGSIIKYFIINPLAWVVIDLAILAIAYLMLRRHPFVDLKRTMIFFGGLTLINILVDIRILDGMLGNLALLGLLAWMLFGGGTKNNRRWR
ncbi:MAG TPA: hypothetical protein PKA28_03115 [Methylomusa anaerophila]|uniref:Uncharacterized protein n=1 Tax=Methylomusa anaerophila TaxID=1930071 RepID=A0A348ANT4_9FIRM|nr:hypothetical protein [Methylomusa anaerophila]BBB92732.1 hypothetical protein MAMMFC1_03427 [Methylomusa anaerophila]HML87415.1 hypothetical protein [Methylomusa anaerophila]